MYLKIGKNSYLLNLANLDLEKHQGCGSMVRVLGWIHGSMYPARFLVWTMDKIRPWFSLVSQTIVLSNIYLNSTELVSLFIKSFLMRGN